MSEKKIAKRKKMDTIKRKADSAENTPSLSMADSSTSLTLIKSTDLELDVEYKVTNLKWVKTKYGDRLVAELRNELQLFLSEAFTTKFENWTRDKLKEVVAGNIKLICRGHKLIPTSKAPIAFIEFKN